jgi:transcriptional regulator with XRE-family HTH domain
MKLKELRINAVMSQRDLSIKSGVAFDTISRLENGKQKPNFVTIRKLAKALNVDPNTIDFS